MTYRAQSVYLAAAIQLGTAGIGVDVHSVDVEVGVGLAQLPLVGPYGVLSSTICLALAGIDDLDLVNTSVAVPVVVAEIHLVVNKLAGLHHHLLWIHVITL